MAFILPAVPIPHLKMSRASVPKSSRALVMSISRRSALRKIALLTATVAFPFLSPEALNAAMYSTETTPQFTTSGDPKKLSTKATVLQNGHADRTLILHSTHFNAVPNFIFPTPWSKNRYMPQIEAGYKTLINLRDNWEAKTSAYDGDVIRRELGTVGVKSPLFGIRKVFLKAWQLIAEESPDQDLIERLESEWNDVLDKISSVDFQLYSVGFTELRETKDSLVTQGRASLDSLISVYDGMLKDFKSATT